MRGNVQEHSVKHGQAARIAEGVPGALTAPVRAARHRLAGMTKTRSRSSLDQRRVLRVLGRHLAAALLVAQTVSPRTVDPRRRADPVVVARLVS